MQSWNVGKVVTGLTTMTNVNSKDGVFNAIKMVLLRLGQFHALGKDICVAE